MIGLLLLVTCALACAQEPNGTRATLGVADAVAAALAGHPALSAAGHLEVAAQAGLRAARARANPEVVIAPTLLGSQGTPEAVSISQPLEVNGARRARVRVATAATQAAAAEREVLARGLALRVRTAYWDAVLAQASVEVERQNVDYARTLVEAATLQVNLGNQPRMHQMKAEVEVARGQQQLIAAQERAALTMAALCGAMGQAPGTNYRLADPLGFGPAAFDEAQLLAGALAARPEVRLAQADVEAADGEAEQTRLARRPDVALTYWQETFDATGGLGVSVSLPVLDWGGQKQRESQVRSLREASQQRLAGVRNGIHLDLYQAAVALRSAEAQVQELRERVLDQSARLAELAATGYREGALTFLDVLESRRTLRTVTLEYEAAMAEHLKAQASLEWASGLELQVASALPEPVARAVSALPSSPPPPAGSAPFVKAPPAPPAGSGVGVATVRRLPSPAGQQAQINADRVVVRR